MSSNSFTIVFCMLLPALYLACDEVFWESKPEIQAFPSKVVMKGANVTIRCSSPYYPGQFRLKGENTAWFDSKHNVYEENFTVTNVQENNSTNYYCIQLACDVWWSKQSDFLTLKVIDPHDPNITCLQEDTNNLITCKAPDPPEDCRVKRFFLYSGKEIYKDLSVEESCLQGTFTVSNLTTKYRCSYVLEVKEQPRHLIESPLSNNVTPTICDRYKPEIQAFPSKVVRKGDKVTIRCSSPYYQGRFHLKGKSTAWFDSKHNVHEENFTVTNVQEHTSNFECIQLSCDNTWIKESDLLTLKVIDPRKPNISGLQKDMQLLITCTAPNSPEECRVKSFYLYSGKEKYKELSAIKGSPQVIFKVSNLTAEYRCSYVLEVKEQPRHLIESPLSDKYPGIMADYTTTNKIRLVLAGALIILACGFIIEYWIGYIKNEQGVLESSIKSEMTGELEGAIYINDPVKG